MAGQGSAAPAVSVVIPNYNGKAWLADAVDSVLTQTFTDFELLVIDDGSTDGSADLLRDLARRDGRLRPIFLDHGGVVRARNHGMAEARAPLIAWLDADDVALPRRLQQQVDYLALRPEAGMVAARAEGVDQSGRAQRLSPTAEPGLSAMRRLEDGPNPIVQSSVMARTELIRRLGGYRPAFIPAEDYDFWLRIGEVSQLAVLPEPLVRCLVHQGSFSQRNALRQAFSVRLARLAAASRRAGPADPCADLTEPPDWTQPPPTGAPWAEDLALFRWCDPSDADDPLTDWARAAGEALLAAVPRLTRGERRFAARAMAARLRSANAETARAARALLGRLVRRYPWAVMKGSWELARLQLRGWVRGDRRK